MSAEDNKEFVLSSYRAFASQDKQQIGSFFAPDAAWVVPEGNATVLALGRSTGWIGREAIVKYLTEDIARLFSNTKVDFLSVTADGDNVIIEQAYEGTVCNGRIYKMVFCFIFVVRDRLIHQVRAYFDTALGFKQIFGEEAPRQLV